MSYNDPFIPTPQDVIPKMLALAAVQPGELVFDLGSGDGRIVIAAARDFNARGVGVELRKRFVKESRRAVKELGLSDRVTITCRSFKEVNLRKADVLALYLSDYVLNQMAPKFLRELRPGTRIVNFAYEVPGWKPRRRIRVKPVGWAKPRQLYLYVM